MSGENFLERLKSGGVLVADGAFGTMLIAKGLQSGACPDALNLTKPEWLDDIARRYVDAGAEIVHTSTFGASPLKLADYGLADKTEEINGAAAAIVRNAAGERAFTAASVGPSGRILKPYGDTDRDMVYDSYERQMRALIGAGADVITVETMTDLREAVLAVKAAKAVSAAIPVMATMTFDRTPRGYYTIMGVNIADAAAGLRDAGADAVGSNCGNGIERMVEIARAFAEEADVPVIIQSNAGKPELRDGEVFYPETPEYFAEKTRGLVDAGVSVIGGCCGTTPEHIRAVKSVVDSQ